MTDLQTIALALVALWLGAITLVVVLLVRQLGLVTLRLDIGGGAPVPLADGPDIGEVVPEAVVARVPQLAQGLRYLLLVSPTCAPCHEIAPQLSGLVLEGQVVALVPGHAEVADDFAAMLPPSFDVVRDPVAVEVAKSLGMELTPAALEIEDGVVSGKAHLMRATDLRDLMNAREQSDAADIVKMVKGV